MQVLYQLSYGPMIVVQSAQAWPSTCQEAYTARAASSDLAPDGHQRPCTCT